MVVTSLLLMVLLPSSGCNEELAVWGLGAEGADAQARVGVGSDDFEVGGSVRYFSDNTDWGPEPDVVGGYFIYHLTQEVTVDDTPKNSPIGPVLEMLVARPYAGAELVVPVVGEKQWGMNWIVGTSFTTQYEGVPWAIVVEYMHGEEGVAADSDDVVSLGLRWDF